MTLDQLNVKRLFLELELRQCKVQIRHLSRDTKTRKPLAKAKPATASAQVKWRKSVWVMFGRECYFCKGTATECAHILTAASLGTAQAYTDPRLARPLCHDCHVLEESNLSIKFPLELRQEAARVHNLTARVPLHVPEI